MRRAGTNPTEAELRDILNKIDDGSATLTFEDFSDVMKEKTIEGDPENHFRDAFRVFSKDEQGICILLLIESMSYIKQLTEQFSWLELTFEHISNSYMQVCINRNILENCFCVKVVSQLKK